MKLELNKFYNIDCMEGMKLIPDKYFDLAIVDPPYGININHNMGRRKGDKNSNYKKVSWDNETPTQEYFEELFRVSRNQIIWGANYYIDKLEPTKSFITWVKPQISEKMSFAMSELAWTSHDKTSKVIELFSVEKDRIHPTQKPVALYKWLLKNYAKEGDKILDTHVGSASSLIACEDMGFQYVGFELDEEYYKKASERIERFKAQIRMF